MKNLNDFLIFENSNLQTPIGKKIDDIMKKNKNKLQELVADRTEKWDKNKFEWSRQPMFLIANPSEDLETHTTKLDFSWVRWKFLKGHKSDIKGTFKNYNVSNDSGGKQNSVIGVFYDREFHLISSINVFNEIYDLLEKEYE